MLRLRSLGSGSTGNATLIEASNVRTRRVLIDCGLSLRVLQQRLSQAGVETHQIDAIFITHEHSDHVGCAHRLALEQRIPIWMSEGTWRASGQNDYLGLLRLTADGQRIDLGELELTALSVPHDAAEPLQLRASDGQHELGVLTDLGHANEAVKDAMAGCHVLLLECNHDTQMLEQSPYPAFLKRRIAGQLGHLSNDQAAQLAQHLQQGQLKQVVAAHLSQKNNRPDLALQALKAALADRAELSVADAQSGTPWIDVSG